MENDWTKVLGFPGYRVYKQDIDEEHKQLKQVVDQAEAGEPQHDLFGLRQTGAPDT